MTQSFSSMMVQLSGDFFAAFVFFPILYFILRRSMSIKHSAWLTFAALITAIICGLVRLHFLRLTREEYAQVPEFLFWARRYFGLREYVLNMAVAAAMFAVPFVAMLYRKWFEERMTNEEKQPGLAGLRAWLSPGKAAWAVLIGLTASVGYAFPLWATLALPLGLLAIYPIYTYVTLADDRIQAHAADDPAADRDRVLKMLEDGKISAEESAELLGALISSHEFSKSRPRPLTPGRKLLLAGAALVLAGFFLPWFQVDLAREMNRAAEKMSGIFPQVFAQGMNQAMARSLSGNTNHAATASAIVTLSGGDIARGMGWAILLFALAAAAMPFLSIRMEQSALRTVAIAALGIGSLFILYLLSKNIRYAAVGLVWTAVGYLALWAGALRRGVFEP